MRTDIKTLLEELIKTGMKDAEIAKEIGANHSTIWRIRTGETKSPIYANGTKIEDLVRRRCPDYKF
jgi:IS30 family transposase